MLGIAASITVGAVLLLSALTREPIRQSLLNQQTALTGTLTSGIGLSLEVDRLDRAQEALQLLQDVPMFHGAAILDADATRILSAPSGFEVPAEFLAIVADDPYGRLRFEVEPLSYTTAPVTDSDGELLGTIVLALSRASILSDERRALVLVVGTLLPVLLLFLGWISWQIFRSQVALERARDAEERSNQAKSQFLANMSHEIRTPLTAILGYAELLLDRSLDRDAIADYAGIIDRNGRHLLSIISDILDLSKIDAGKLEVELVPCSPLQIVSDAVSLLRVRAEQKGLSLELSYADDIPQLVRTDPTRLRQSLLNLAGNAIKFTDTGSVCVAVNRAEGSTGEPMLEVHVADTGVGLTADMLERIFDPFGQADQSTTRRFGGTGLGLTISREIARLLGGDIVVESRVNRGSKFTLSVRADPVTASQARSDDRQRPVPKRLQGRVLLVEDGPDNRRLIGLLLKRVGLAMDVAEHGAEALEIVESSVADGNPYDLILMDMQMPVMDGYAATKELRARGHLLPIIAVTANALSTDRAKCVAAGCNDYTSKPVRPAELYAVLAKFLAPGDEPSSAAETSTAETSTATAS